MQRLKQTAAITAVILLASGVTVFAQGRGGGAQKPKTQGGAPKAAATAPKATTAAPKAAAAPKAPHGGKVNSQAAVKPAKANTGATSGKAPKAASGAVAKGKKADTSTATTSVAANVSTSTATTSPSTTPTGTRTLTPVQQKLQKNTNLANKLQSRLPRGTDLMQAADGFRNLGQFVAAVNVSNNLGIDFVKLKSKMVDDGNSLGQSIQALKPASTGTVEARHAEFEARGLIAETEAQVTTTATVTNTTTTAQKPKGKKSGSLDE